MEKTRGSTEPDASEGERHPDDPRRRAFLSAAGELFLDQGFDTVSIDAIISRAGGSKTSIYRFFGGKFGLLEALIVDECARLTGDLHPINAFVRRAESLEVALNFIGQAYLAIITNPRSLSLNRLIITQSRRFPHLASLFIAAGPDAATRAIAEAFEILRSRSFVGLDADLASAVRRFVGMLRSDIQLKMLLGDTIPSAAARRILVGEASDAVIRILERNDHSPGIVPLVDTAVRPVGIPIPLHAGGPDSSSAPEAAPDSRSASGCRSDVERLYGPDDPGLSSEVPFSVSVGYQIRVTHRALQRNLQLRIEPFGVTLGMWYFLRVLWQSDGLSQRELSRRIGTMEPTTLSAIAAMEARGLVRRERDKQDRRRQRVLLTQRGRELGAILLPVAADTVRDAAAGLSPTEVAQLLKFLDTIQANLRDEAAVVDEE